MASEGGVGEASDVRDFEDHVLLHPQPSPVMSLEAELQHPRDARDGRSQSDEPRVLYDIVDRKQRRAKNINEHSGFQWLRRGEVP